MVAAPSRMVHAHDTTVTLRRPLLVGVACLLTLGIAGAVHHHRLSRDLARFGRARGAMPFPFIPVDPGTSTLAWSGGLLLWWGAVAGLVDFAIDMTTGYNDLGSEDVTLLASLLLLLAPAWIVAARTMMRIRTARHMTGSSGHMPSPTVAATLAALVPPIGSWQAQRELNRAWAEYAR